MKPVQGRITTDFYEPRPLSKPIEKRDHVHGAIDIGVSMGTPILMPEDGRLWRWAAFRYEQGEVWPEMPILIDYGNSFCNYFYDTFGGIIIVHSADELRTHIIAHLYCNQLFNRFDQRVHYIEEKKKARFAIHGLFTESHEEKEGSVIGYVGDAGFSSGPHVHWEIHHGSRWEKWESRINPVMWL